MTTLHVCARGKVREIVERTGARHVVTLLPADPGHDILKGVDGLARLHLDMDDVDEPLAHHILPGRAHVADLLAFVHAWDQRTPMVMHCLAGISRSPAAAFVALCALNPAVTPERIAAAMRAAAPAIQPNRLIVALGDEALGRGGAMIAANEDMRDGNQEAHGPFALPAIFI